MPGELVDGFKLPSLTEKKRYVMQKYSMLPRNDSAIKGLTQIEVVMPYHPP